MLIYSGTKGQFREDVAAGCIAQRIQDELWERNIFQQNISEFQSWESSLTEMNRILGIPDIDDSVQVAIEYQIPQTAKRVDFIIAGIDERNKENVVIIELKQWESARKTSRHGVVKAYTGGRLQEVAHPSYQAYSYAKTIENFNSTIQDDHILMNPCAYLHNYKNQHRSEIDSLLYQDITQLAPLFTKDEENKLRDFIRKYVNKGPKRDLLYQIDHGKIRPSKALQDALGSMMEGNTEFIMIDEQKVVYERVLELVNKAIDNDEKYTVIVEGGPGTGKSVVAIQLLAELISKRGLNAQYITKNSAPRNVYFEKLKQDRYKLSYIKNLFKSSSVYFDIPENTFDCLIVDESHRLNAKSGIFQNKGVNQIKEIIEASKVSVFFIDEDQVVTTKDIGSVDEIVRWAEASGSTLYYDDSTKLVSQFRCNGSDGYIAFIDDLLQLRQAEMIDDFITDYEIRLFDNPSDMREALRQKNMVNNKSRMIAGYCYDWITKKDFSEGAFDIVLGDTFKAKWNFANTGTWAIDEESFDQVGCIHTSQGLEFDYVGIIIGKDLRYDGERVITDLSKRAKTDQSLRGLKSKPDPELANRIIRNTYKTLLTRGQKGCFVYCEDRALQEYIKERILRLVN